jgi:hypothetical protein
VISLLTLLADVPELNLLRGDVIIRDKTQSCPVTLWRPLPLHFEHTADLLVLQGLATPTGDAVCDPSLAPGGSARPLELRSGVDRRLRHLKLEA